MRRVTHGLEIIGNLRGGVTRDRCPKATAGGKMVTGPLGAQAMTQQGCKNNKSIKGFNQYGVKEKRWGGGDCSRRQKIHVTKVHFYKTRSFSF